MSRTLHAEQEIDQPELKVRLTETASKNNIFIVTADSEKNSIILMFLSVGFVTQLNFEMLTLVIDVFSGGLIP